MWREGNVGDEELCGEEEGNWALSCASCRDDEVSVAMPRCCRGSASGTPFYLGGQLVVFVSTWTRNFLGLFTFMNLWTCEVTHKWM